MVVIRLSRGGAKKRPFYHLVVTDSRKARDSGAYIERVGYFNPVARGQEVRLHIETDRVDYWVSNGAQPSDRVKQLLKDFANPEAAEATREKKKAKVEAKKAAAAAAAAAEAEAEAQDDAPAEQEGE